MKGVDGAVINGRWKTKSVSGSHSYYFPNANSVILLTRTQKYYTATVSIQCNQQLLQKPVGRPVPSDYTTLLKRTVGHPRGDL